MRARARSIDDAMAFHRRGDLASAEKGYRKVLRREPQNPDALHLLGAILESRGEADKGIALIERALRSNPGLAEAHYNLGNILKRRNRPHDAERHFRRAVELQPRNPEALNNLGGILLRLDRYAEAETFLMRALELNPNLTSALTNMGAVTEMTGRINETIAFYDRVLAREPENADVHHQKAGALLIRGHFPEGWQELAWRFRRTDSHFGVLPFPRWRGEALAGKGIVVWREQGLGEELLLGTMIADLIARAARVMLICAPRLVPLFRRTFPGLQVIAADGEPKPAALFAGIDFQASLSDLGLQFRRAFEAFPGKPYLVADPNLVAACRAKYQAVTPGNQLVGLSWHSKSAEGGEEKSIALDRWTEILRTPGVTFVSLQYGECEAEIRALEQSIGVRIITDREIDPLADLDRFAAQVAAMDLTLSVSNTTVHVAGALGTPVWALIPSNRGRLWYWFLDRKDSPWYPGLRLFRQAVPGRWDEPLAEMAAALRARSHEGVKTGNDVVTGSAAIIPLRGNALRARYQASKPNAVVVGLAWNSATAAVNGILQWGPVLNVPDVTFVSLQSGDYAGELADAIKGFKIPIVDDGPLQIANGAKSDAERIGALDLVITTDGTVARAASALDVPVFFMSEGRSDDGGVRVFHRPHNSEWLGAICEVGIALLDFAASRNAVRNPVAYLRGMASAFTKLDRPADAEMFYRRLQQEPGAATEALYCIGDLKQAAHDLVQALAFYDQALMADPSAWQPYNAKGTVLADLNRFDEAIAAYTEGLKRNPNSPEINNNLGTALRRLGRSAEALQPLSIALRLLPDHTGIMLNYASALDEVGATAEALKAFGDLIARAPDYVDAHYNRSQILLSTGDFQAGWPESLWRLKRPAANVRHDHFPSNPWDGSDISRKEILVWTEQGIGEEILTAGMLGDAVATAKHVTFLCSERLVPLMRRSFPEATVEERREPLPEAARNPAIVFQMSFSDLGASFRRSFADFPARKSFLEADPVRRDALRAKYKAMRPGAPLVGLSWSSKNNHEIGWLKSNRLAGWQPILTVPGAHFVSLQYGDNAAELAEVRALYGVDILDDRDIDPLRDMDSFAAQVAAMDLVISVSNTTVHTAGALGIPAWVLLAEGPGRIWYWFRGREDSPWYPSVRLLRQPQAGAWMPIINRCAADLSAWMGTAARETKTA